MGFFTWLQAYRQANFWETEAWKRGEQLRDTDARHAAQVTTLTAELDRSREAAEALAAAGFVMGAGTVDQDQNARLRTVEERLTRLEGWAGLPT